MAPVKAMPRLQEKEKGQKWWRCKHVDNSKWSPGFWAGNRTALCCKAHQRHHTLAGPVNTTTPAVNWSIIANQSADDRPITDFIIASMPKDCFKLETLENEGGPGREYLTKEIFFSLKTWTVENCKAELLHVLE